MTCTRRLTALALLLAAALAPSLRAQPAGALDTERNLGALYEVLSNDYRTAGTVSRLENDAAYFATNPNANTSVSEAERKKIVAMARNGDINRLLFEASLEELRFRSRELRRLLDATRGGTPNPKAQVWDVLIVGGGIHDQIINNVLSSSNPNLRVLTVEETNLVASNFALARSLGRINSSNRATISDRLPRPGVGNLNEFPLGPLQVPDVSSVKFPTFSALSDVATVNRAASGAEMLFNDSVVTVEDKQLEGRKASGWPARYRVTLQSGAVVYAEVIGYSAGLGDPTIPKLGDAASRTALEAEVAKGENVFSYNAFIRRAAASNTPYREYVGKRVAVIGSGDSGKVSIEWLLRLAPDTGYAEDTAQVGQVGKIYWVGQDKTTCEEYLNGVRNRYADIASGFKSGIVEALPDRFVKFEALPNGTYEVRTESGEKAIVDKVILATGFESRVEKTLERIVSEDKRGKALGPKNPVTESSAVEDVVGQIGTQERGASREAVVARKLKKVKGVEQQIYFFGAGGGNIVQRDETAGITENLKSIFALGARTAALGKLIAASLGGRKSEIDSAARYVIKSGEATSGEVRVPALGDRVSPFLDVLLETQLKSTLRRSFDLSAELAALELTFKVAEGKAVVVTNKPIAKASLERLVAALEGNPSLMEKLGQLVIAGQQVKIKLVREGTGRVTTPERMKISRLTSRDLALDGERGIGIAGRLRVGETISEAAGRRRVTRR